MLAQARTACRQLGLTELLITCGEHNLGSRRVIEANSGALQAIVDGEAHYRLATSQHDT
jgi:predicted acetyltransferase